MQLSDSSCGELQIAKQKDGIARCRAAFPNTQLHFVVELDLSPGVVVPARFEFPAIRRVHRNRIRQNSTPKNLRFR